MQAQLEQGLGQLAFYRFSKCKEAKRACIHARTLAQRERERTPLFPIKTIGSAWSPGGLDLPHAREREREKAIVVNLLWGFNL